MTTYAPAADEIIELAAGLRGRGGAGFPTAAKLAAVRAVAAPRTVVANGEEGEPGSLKDRWLLRERPEQVLAGLRLAAVAVGAGRSVVYLSDAAAEASVRAVAPPEVEIIRVAPRYVAGEETSIVRVLDGGPALPLAKPPRPDERGVLVLNVESLARLARRAGGEADPPLLATLTGGGRPATLHEVRPGTTLRRLVEAHTPDPVRGVLAGGLFGGFLTTLDVEVGCVRAAGRRRPAGRLPAHRLPRRGAAASRARLRRLPNSRRSPRRRRGARMKLLLDSTRCQGYGLCHEKAPELADLDEWGYAAITRQPSSPEDDRAARAAIEACPAQALRS